MGRVHIDLANYFTDRLLIDFTHWPELKELSGFLFGFYEVSILEAL